MNNSPSLVTRFVTYINSHRLDIVVVLLICMFTVQLFDYFGIYPTWFDDTAYIEYEPYDYDELEVTYDDPNMVYPTNPEDAMETGTHLGGTDGLGNPASDYVKNDIGTFYNGESLTVDHATFDVIKGNLKPMKGSLTYSYAKDKERVFYDGIEVVGAAPSTFIPIENGAGRHSYGTDGTHVFYGPKKIEGADPTTFTILWETVYEGCRKALYSKDTQHVYVHTQEYLPGAGLLYTTYIVPNADPKTFESLQDPYGKDMNGYYKEGFYVGPNLDERLLVCEYW